MLLVGCSPSGENTVNELTAPDTTKITVDIYSSAAAVELPSSYMEYQSVTIGWDESSYTDIPAEFRNTTTLLMNTNTGPETSYTLEGLDFNALYSLSVKARDVNGNVSGFSELIQFRTSPAIDEFDGKKTTKLNDTGVNGCATC